MAAAKHDFTPTSRQRIYDTLVILAGVVVPIAAIWGITVDEQLVAAVVAVVSSVLAALGNYLARRNIDDYVGQHRAGE